MYIYIYTSSYFRCFFHPFWFIQLFTTTYVCQLHSVTISLVFIRFKSCTSSRRAILYVDIRGKNSKLQDDVPVK